MYSIHVLHLIALDRKDKERRTKYPANQCDFVVTVSSHAPSSSLWTQGQGTVKQQCWREIGVRVIPLGLGGGA